MFVFVFFSTKLVTAVSTILYEIFLSCSRNIFKEFFFFLGKSGLKIYKIMSIDFVATN